MNQIYCQICFQVKTFSEYFMARQCFQIYQQTGSKTDYQV